MITINKRIIGLDALRSFALFMVLFGHNATLFNPLIHLPIIGNLAGKALAIHEIIGFSGVEIFFVLSGFLITDIVFKYFNNNRNNFAQLKLFLIRRWLRTLPNYYFMYIVNTILYVWILKEKTFDWKFILFIQNLNYPHPDFYREAWSLATEEWFYCLLPIILIAIYNFKKLDFKNSILLTCLLMFLFSFALKIFHIQQYGMHLNFDENIRKVVLLRFDNLIIGILCYVCFYYYNTLFLKYKNWLFWFGLLLIIPTVPLFYAAYQNKFYLYHHNNLIAIYCNFIFLPTLGFITALIIPKLYYLNLDKQKYLSAFFKKSSQLAYSMYLINLPIYKLFFFRNNLIPDSIGSSIMYILLFLLINYGIAQLIYKYIESPFLKYRDRKYPNVY